MITIDPNECTRIHNRNLDISTYATGGDAIIVEGTLLDNRFQDTYLPGGNVRPAGPVHHLIIRMLVRGPGLVIEDIDVEMPIVPRAEACRETLDSLEPLKGMPISSGFTARVKELVGGPKGCAHLTALLLAMAPAAVQGAWAAVARQSVDSARLSERALDFVVDTCRVWRSDGPLVKEYTEKIHR